MQVKVKQTCLFHFNLLHRVHQFRKCRNKKQTYVLDSFVTKHSSSSWDNFFLFLLWIASS